MRLAKIKTLRMTAFVTCLFFLTSEVCLFGQSLIIAPPMSAEGPASSALAITLPSNLGTVEEVVQGTGPVLFHIQEAHGDPYSQKKIKKILEYLKTQYGVQHVFLEGDAAELHPEFVRFFPDQPEWTREAVDQLFKLGRISGPEAYLAVNDKAKAFPIEQKELYESNLRAFKEVLEAREKARFFLSGMDLQIKRLAAPYMSADLRRWVSRLEDYQKNQIPFDVWLMELQKRSASDLKIEIDSPRSQADWPMLVRVFTLQRIEKEFNQDEFQVERKKFLGAVSRFIPTESLKQTKENLQISLSRGRLPFPETEIFFEKLAAALPSNFDYARYPQVMRFIGHLILQSELDAKELAAEIEKLQNFISDKLAVSPKEKEIVRLLKSYRLLEKLFALELTGEEYEKIAMRDEQQAMNKKKATGERGKDHMAAASGERLGKVKGLKVKIEKGAGLRKLKPSKLIQKFGRLNSDQRVLDLKIENLGTIDDLYDKSLGFYRLARQRDGVMIRRIEETLAEKRVKKAAIITGGFHSQPFQQHFAAKGQSYVLITPAMKGGGARDAYVETILKNYNPAQSPAKATVRLFDQALTPARYFPKGWSVKPSRDAMLKTVTDVLTRHQQTAEPRISAMAFVVDRQTRSEVRNLPESEKESAAAAWTLFEVSAKKFIEMIPGKTNFEVAEATLEDFMSAFEGWSDYSQDNLESSSQIKTELSLGLDLFFGLIRWIYWIRDEKKYKRFIFAVDQIMKRLMETQTLQLRKELRLPREHGMISSEERERLAALEPALLSERFDLLADYLKLAMPIFFIWRETLERVRPAEEKLPLTASHTFSVELAGKRVEFTTQESVIPPEHNEFKQLRYLLSLSGMTWLRNLGVLLSAESRSKDPAFKAHVRKSLEDFFSAVKPGQGDAMDPIRHVKEIASELDRDDEWNFLDDVLEQIETKISQVFQGDTSEAVRNSLEVFDQGVKSIRAVMAPQRSEVRNWVFKNIQLSDIDSIKRIEREIWQRGGEHYLKDVMQPQHFGAEERRRVQIFNPAGLRIASWPVGEFSPPKGARKGESLLSDLLLDEAEAYLKDLIHPDMDISETRVSLAERNDDEGTPWFDIYLNFPDSSPDLPSGVFSEISGPEHQSFHEIFLQWYSLLYVRHEMPIEEMDLSAQRLEKVGASNDIASYRQAALERIGETAYFIRDELALNKRPEEIVARVIELLGLASQDFIRAGDDFQKDEPLWFGKGYPDYGMEVLQRDALPLVKIMAHLYGQGSGAKSEVRSSSDKGKLFNLVEGDASIPLAIRYLDLFFQLAEEKVAVENQTGNRDFGFDIPRKGSRVSYTPPGAREVLLLATDFRFPGGDQDYIVMESDYPIWLESQKGTGVLEAIYIAADKDPREYLKLEILSKKRNRSGVEPFNALPFLGDFKMQGPLIIESLLKQIPASTKNGLVLRASVVEAESIGFKKRSEVRASVVSEQVQIVLDAKAIPPQREKALFALEKLHEGKKVLPEERPEFWRALIYAASLPPDGYGAWKLYRAASSIFESRVSAETGNTMNLRESEFRQTIAHIDIHQKNEESSVVVDAPGANVESAALRIGTEIIRGHSSQEFVTNLKRNPWIRKSGLMIKAKDAQNLTIVLEDRLVGWLGALQSAGLWHGMKILDETVPYKSARLLNRVLAVGIALGSTDEVKGRSEVRAPIEESEINSFRSYLISKAMVKGLDKVLQSGKGAGILRQLLQTENPAARDISQILNGVNLKSGQPQTIISLVKKYKGEQAGKPGSPWFDVIAWHEQTYWPASQKMEQELFNGKVTGTRFAEWVHQSIHPVAPDFTYRSFPEGAILQPADIHDFSVRVLKEVFIPRGMIAQMSAFDNSKMAIGRIVRTEQTDTLAGRTIPVYYVKPLHSGEFGEGVGTMDYIVLATDLEDAVRSIHPVMRQFAEGRAPMVSFRDAPSQHYMQMVGSSMWGRFTEDIAVQRTIHDTLAEEMSHSDGHHFVSQLRAGVNAIFSDQYSLDQGLSVIKPQTGILKGLLGVMQGDGSEIEAVPIFRQTLGEDWIKHLAAQTPEARNSMGVLFADVFFELEAKLNALRHAKSPAYALLEPLSQEVFETVAQDFGGLKYGLTSRFLLAELSGDLMGGSTLNPEAWLRYVASNLRDIKGYNDKLRTAADSAYQRLFYSLEERQAVLVFANQVRPFIPDGLQSNLEPWYFSQWHSLFSQGDDAGLRAAVGGLVKVHPDSIDDARASQLADQIIALRSEVRATPGEPLERYKKLTNFYAEQRVREGMNWDGTLFVPSPMGVLPLIFKEIERTLGKPLKKQNYLALGAGLLHDSLYAASVEGMNVKAIERDSALSIQAQDILNKAQMQNLVTELQVRFFPGEDAFDQSWADVDVAYFFYTQSGGNRAAYRANFEKRLLEKFAEMNPGSVFAMLFTGSQLMAEQAEFDGLEPYFQDQVQVSPERTGLYLRTYKIPEKNASRSEVRSFDENILPQYIQSFERRLPELSKYVQALNERSHISSYQTHQIWSSVLRMRNELLGYQFLGMVPLPEEINEPFKRNFLEAFLMIRVKDVKQGSRTLVSLDSPALSIAALSKIVELLKTRAEKMNEGGKGTASGESFRLPDDRTLYFLYSLSLEILLQFAQEMTSAGAETALQVIRMRLTALQIAKGMGIPTSEYGPYQDISTQIQLMSFLVFGEVLSEADFIQQLSQDRGQAVRLLDRAVDVFTALFELKLNIKGGRSSKLDGALKLLPDKVIGYRADSELDKTLLPRIVKVVTGQVVFRSEVRSGSSSLTTRLSLPPERAEVHLERSPNTLQDSTRRSRSEVRLQEGIIKSDLGSMNFGLSPERWVLAQHSTGHLVPLDIREQYGEEVFRAAVHVLLLKLEPDEVSNRPVLASEITEHIRATMPEFYRMITMKPLAQARRLLEDAVMAAPADVLKTEMLLPMIALLAARPDLEYTLILEGDGQRAVKFKQALKLTVKNSKLGFNPFDLQNFKVVSETDELAVRRLVSQSLSKTQGATAVVSTRNSILDPLNAVPNLALVLVKNPLRQRDTSLLTAAFIDELVQSRLVRYDEDSLAQQVHSQSLLLEVQALQAFLIAA